MREATVQQGTGLRSLYNKEGRYIYKNRKDKKEEQEVFVTLYMLHPKVHHNSHPNDLFKFSKLLQRRAQLINKVTKL